MTQQISKPVIIFEGPDCAGKTTAIESFLKRHPDYLYIHHGAYPQVTTGLARLYADSMSPALMGYQPIVMDRGWLSELPYGVAFRDGRDRLGAANRRHLERLAMRCGAIVILCLPPWENVRSGYVKRKELEYLENETQLKMVYDFFDKSLVTSLPLFVYDYTMTPVFKDPPEIYHQSHPISLRTAGNLNASVLLVGDKFAERGDGDAWFQWPFASLTGDGCSRWLTCQLEEAGISERSLCWINADQLPSESFDLSQFHTVTALGANACDKLTSMGITHHTEPHPQRWKRFNYHDTYPLITYLKEVIHD